VTIVARRHRIAESVLYNACIFVGACNHRRSCSQTAPFPARISCQ
jgi:hypothetical protein